MQAQEAGATSAATALDEAEVKRLYHHWLSLPWYQYRSGMPPLTGGITTDVGWGCTLRSGQMLLARAMTVLCLGPDWRLVGADDDVRPPGAEVYAQILRMFRDTPDAPCGLHALVRHGAPFGVSVGAWLGPHGLCNALHAMVSHTLAPGQLRVCVLSSGGGGAPTLFRDDLADECRRANTRPQTGCTTGAVLPHPASSQPWTPLLLLVPLVLGLGRLNMVYAPQLCAVLGMRQSCGIVGGRPGSSHYFVGCVGDAIVFLDPHDVQAHVADQDCDDVAAHQCGVIRHTPLSGIDPSLALAFLVSSEAEFDALCEELRRMEQASGGAPLLTVASRAAHMPLAEACDTDTDEEDGRNDEWTVL